MRRPDGQRRGKPKLIFVAGCSRPPSSTPMCTSSRLARSWRASACTMLRSRDDAVERVAAYARHHPDAQVIIGHGWDERAWPEPMPPTRTELDRAAGGVAVYLARVDVHSAVVSSTLLDRLPGVAEAIGYRADGLLSREAHHLCRGSLDRLFTDHQRRSAAARRCGRRRRRVWLRCTSWVARISDRSRT